MKLHKGTSSAVNASAINLLGVAFAVLLGVQILLMPPASYKLTVLSPYLASTVIMLGLGPYLFVPPMCGWWLTAALYAAHLVFAAVLARRMRLWNCFGRFADKMRVTAVIAAAVVSAMGIGFELPRAGHYEIKSSKVAGEPIRLVVVSDLHSCDYGKDQVSLFYAGSREQIQGQSEACRGKHDVTGFAETGANRLPV